MRLARAGGQVWEPKEEAGSGLNLQPTGCGRVGCRPRAGCRNLPGRCWGHALLLLPSRSLPGGPATLPKPTWAHRRAKGAPGGQPAAHGPPTPRAHVHVPPVRSLAPSVLEPPCHLLAVGISPGWEGRAMVGRLGGW